MLHITVYILTSEFLNYLSFPCSKHKSKILRKNCCGVTHARVMFKTSGCKVTVNPFKCVVSCLCAMDSPGTIVVVFQNGDFYSSYSFKFTNCTF